MAKAVVLTKYGPPDVLVWSDVPMPQPGAGQIRIRVKAAGVSPTDPKIRRGHEEGWIGCLGNLEKMLEAQTERNDP